MAGVMPGHPHNSYLKGFAPGYARTALLIATGLVTVNKIYLPAINLVEQPKYNRSHRTQISRSHRLIFSHRQGNKTIILRSFIHELSQ